MRSRVREAFHEVFTQLRAEGLDLPESVPLVLEKPRRAELGDLATNVALAVAKAVGRPPRALAEALCGALLALPDTPFAAVEVAGPGFLNLRVKDRVVLAVLGEVLAQGERYGQHPPVPGERVLLEFVSANPTGPLHLAHARGAVVGDVLARLLRAAGLAVETEYYVNDLGAQVLKLAASVRAAHLGEPPPEGGYGGAYVAELAQALRASAPALLDGPDGPLAERCVEEVLGGIRRTLDRLGIHFARFFSERSLGDGRLEATLDALASGGHLEARDGALFFRGGDTDKDRVLRKSSGDLTYFASDLAYHRDKLARGHTRLVDVWGADHHGYIPRMRAGLEALGLPGEAFEVLLLQMVKLLKDGKEVRMGKRLGNFITVDEVLDEVDEATGHPGAGRDALRFLILARSHESPVEFDLAVASAQSVENPVFYAQMTHARMCSILHRAEHSEELLPAREAGVLYVPDAPDPVLVEKLTLPEERAILAACDAFPELVREAAEARAPHRVAFWALEFAQGFASYFTRMQRVHDAPILPQKGVREADPGWVRAWDWETTRARLLWLRAVRQVYANALALLGVEAPTRMTRSAEP
ncbi:MAG: arginine--tRNA ligase [Deltaproteobacteria bacterium]|nr:arginine--tRNA ligase [Deltaproteobacteria bacterium]